MFTRKTTETRYGPFGLKERLLFCLSQSPQPPRELMESLGMVKSNLALLAKKCINEDLIEKTRKSDDGRSLLYSLTDKGRGYLDNILNDIEKKFTTVLTEEKERNDAMRRFYDAVELLSFIP